MAEPVQGIFVLSVRALAGLRNSVPDFQRYDLLVFARGEDEQAAGVVALNGLASLGWEEPEMLRSGEIVDEGAVPEDMRGAMERARANGCAIIVYDEP